MKTGPLYDEMRQVEKTIKAAKKLRKEKFDPAKPWPPEGYLAQWQIQKLGKQATVLYCFIAQSRGRVHCQGWTLEQQKAFVDERLSPILKTAIAAAA